MANTHQVLQGVKDYTLDLLGTEFRDVAVAAAGRSESAATRSEGAAESVMGDAAATAADRVATGEDRAQTGEDREAAEQWAGQSKDAATLAITAAATASQYVGDGFPEGKVTAPVGAVYVDTAATSGAVRWIKTSGTGTTGWQVEYGNTGWRNVSSALADVLESGKVFFRRRGDVVDIVTEWAKFIPAGTTQMPAGFRPFRNDAVPFYASATLATPVAQLRIAYTGNITINIFDDRYSANDQGTLTTSDPWPTSLPGTPA